MNQGFIKVAAGTPGVTVADCRANTKAILEMIKEMEAQHAKIMVFPELCITGYTCQDLFLQRRLLDSAWESLLTLAEETRDVDALIFVGLPDEEKWQALQCGSCTESWKYPGICA